MTNVLTGDIGIAIRDSLEGKFIQTNVIATEHPEEGAGSSEETSEEVSFIDVGDPNNLTVTMGTGRRSPSGSSPARPAGPVFRAQAGESFITRPGLTPPGAYRARACDT